MGKVHFPLINIRKDIVGDWHMHHYTGDSAETITVPEFADSNNYYTAWLTEIPDSGTNKTLGTTPPRISGLTEYRGNPVDPNTKRINFTNNQFYVNYQTGQLMFPGALAGQTFKVDYWGKGSLIEADDINALEERVTDIEKTKDPIFFSEFDVDAPKQLEIGEAFPSLFVPQNIKFNWTVNRPDILLPSSIKIVNLSNNMILAQNIDSDKTEIEVEFFQSITYSKAKIIKFRISAQAYGNRTIEKDLEVQWNWKAYYFTSPDKNISNDQVINDQSFIIPNGKEYIKFNLPEGYQQYKVICLPKNLKISSFIDLNTGFQFVVDNPIDLIIPNSNSINMLYNCYVSSYPISGELNLVAYAEVPEDD